MNKIEVVKTPMNADKRYGLVDTLCRVFGKSIKVNVGFSKNARDSGIEKLALSVRIYNALLHANASTIEVLIELLNEDRVKKFEILGQKV